MLDLLLSGVIRIVTCFLIWEPQRTNPDPPPYICRKVYPRPEEREKGLGVWMRSPLEAVVIIAESFAFDPKGAGGGNPTTNVLAIVRKKNHSSR